jgi:type I restriction-modification system DNA methylase subunit
MEMKNKQIKSKERVKEKGEVFTNPREVNAMLDLIPEITLSQTFLEPSCGTGNFLVEILNRKLKLCKNGDDVEIALKSIFGVDIMEDNVFESRSRLLVMCIDFLENKNTDIMKICDFTNNYIQILETNIVCGDFLTKLDKDGKEIWFLKETNDKM